MNGTEGVPLNIRENFPNIVVQGDLLSAGGVVIGAI